MLPEQPPISSHLNITGNGEKRWRLFEKTLRPEEGKELVALDRRWPSFVWYQVGDLSGNEDPCNLIFVLNQYDVFPFRKRIASRIKFDRHALIIKFDQSAIREAPRIILSQVPITGYLHGHDEGH